MRRGFPLTLLLLVLTGGCGRTTPPQGLVHTVTGDETLSDIARLYRVPLGRVITANQLTDHRLHAGQEIVVPGGVRPAPPPTAAVARGLSPQAYRPRHAWALAPLDRTNMDPMGVPPYRITVHHTAMGDDDADLPGLELLRRIEALHRKRGYAGIGYHFIIDGNGAIWEGRPLRWQGAHAKGENNKGNIGVVLAGNYHQRKPSAHLRRRLCGLINALRQAHGIPASAVHGHRHFRNTECPGRHLWPLVEAYQRNDPDVVAIPLE
ncbi:MAG: N-acetylmuramoyl-L-alanine amidase [Planctomycetota bacterium]